MPFNYLLFIPVPREKKAYIRKKSAPPIHIPYKVSWNEFFPQHQSSCRDSFVQAPHILTFAFALLNGSRNRGTVSN